MLEEKATFETGRTSIAEPIFRHSMVPMRDIGKNYSTEGKPRKIFKRLGFQLWYFMRPGNYANIVA